VENTRVHENLTTPVKEILPEKAPTVYGKKIWIVLKFGKRFPAIPNFPYF